MKTIYKVAIFGIIIQVGGIIYGIINNAQDVLVMSIFFLFVTTISLFNKKKQLEFLESFYFFFLSGIEYVNVQLNPLPKVLSSVTLLKPGIKRVSKLSGFELDNNLFNLKLNPT